VSLLICLTVPRLRLGGRRGAHPAHRPRAGRRTPLRALSSLQPGDLVFFAIYVGGGMIIDVPRTGLTVKK